MSIRILNRVNYRIGNEVQCRNDATQRHKITDLTFVPPLIKGGEIIYNTFDCGVATDANHDECLALPYYYFTVVSED